MTVVITILGVIAVALWIAVIVVAIRGGFNIDELW